MIYGSSPRDLHKFREGRTGLLKMTLFNQQVFIIFIDKFIVLEVTDYKILKKMY